MDYLRSEHAENRTQIERKWRTKKVGLRVKVEGMKMKLKGREINGPDSISGRLLCF